jgi:hypothetical protein
VVGNDVGLGVLLAVALGAALVAIGIAGVRKNWVEVVAVGSVPAREQPSPLCKQHHDFFRAGQVAFQCSKPARQSKSQPKRLFSQHHCFFS